MADESQAREQERNPKDDDDLQLPDETAEAVKAGRKAGKDPGVLPNKYK